MSVALRNLRVLLTATGLLLIKGSPKLISGTFSTLKGLVGFFALISVDAIIFTGNLLLPQIKKGTVVAPGKPGYKGIWPEFVAPNSNFDSRSPCPYLNALANHGILPRDGRNISSAQFQTVFRECLNASPTLAKNTTNGVEALFGKSIIDLGDLSRHNVIEHDASALRADTYFQPDQGQISKDIISSLLASASRPSSADHPEGALSAADIAKSTKGRIADSKKHNPTFTGLSAFHTLFMGNNLSLLLDCVDGDVRALRTILLEERFPDGFETWWRQRGGYSLIEMNLRSAEILLRMA